MPSQKKNFNSTPQFSNLYAALSSQSIVDVFVVQGLILPADGEKIKNRFRNNTAIERFLLANKIVSREAINKAYSIILKLPFIGLRSLNIPDAILQIVPERVGKKYQIVPFAKNDQIISLAVGNPGELFLPAGRNLEQTFAAKGLRLELFVTTPEDLASVWNRGKSKDKVLLDQSSLPVIFLRNRNIDPMILKMLPLDFILANRMAIFDRVEKNRYRIALENPYSPETRKIIDYLKTENNLEFEEFSTSKNDIDYLISLYEKNLSKPEKSPLTREEADQPGIFSNLMESLVSDNKPGIKTEETLQSAPSETKSKSGVVAAENKNHTSEINSEMASTAKSEEEEKDIGELLGREIHSLNELLEITKENSIPKLVAAMISYALYLGSSDIHIEPEAKKVRVRFRIDGILKDILQLPRELELQVSSRIKILGSMKLDETRIPQDGRFSVKFMDREVDVRVSVLPTVYGEKTVMRILDKSAGILSLEDLGFVGSAFRIVMEEVKQPYGIILATGPTGSGKSTTLYAILNRLNQPGVNVVTLEDPVEYEIPGINQCQIKPKIGFTFAEGLRSILRQDPNIIMVGEIRDSDTASMATHAALTGHLVLSTLHTNDASSALPRLINMGIEPFLITSSINLIIAQRLVRRICTKCREKVEVPPALKAAMEKELANIPASDKEDRARIKEVQFYRGRGCSECTEGYRGRIGIYELLVMNEEIENLAVSHRPASEIKEAAIKSGMLTMRQDGILKAINGLTTIDEILLATGEVGVGQAINIAKEAIENQKNIPNENQSAAV